MELAAIATQYYEAFIAKYGDSLLLSQRKALHAICRCRTPASGEVYVQCSECNHTEWRPLSCGNRNCPKCQNHQASQWIDKQQEKLLPVPYFMATFTLPCELRKLAWRNQKTVYSLFFKCVASTLKDFGLNQKNLGAEIGMTMVMHTNNRKLDYHPHIHAVIPGGGIDKRHRFWKKAKGEYLFNSFSLAKVFRARCIAELEETGFSLPPIKPKKWFVDCRHVGKGATILKYLSRYLYRGVLGEKNIVANKNGNVTFKYVESKSGDTCFRTLRGEDFLKLLLQHVLPKGFRRVRDYGFLHGNAKKWRGLIQLILYVKIAFPKPRVRPTFKCSSCRSPMFVVGFRSHFEGPG
ncbi:IS91 family transposase [Desulforhopalus sp. 52FAK]